MSFFLFKKTKVLLRLIRLESADIGSPSCRISSALKVRQAIHPPPPPPPPPTYVLMLSRLPHPASNQRFLFSEIPLLPKVLHRHSQVTPWRWQLLHLQVRVSWGFFCCLFEEAHSKVVLFRWKALFNALRQLFLLLILTSSRRAALVMAAIFENERDENSSLRWLPALS